MELVVGFALSVLAGLLPALLIARGEPQEHPLPWELMDLTRMQAGLMATLGAVSITGIVLIAGLFSRGSPATPTQLATVGLMFAVAFGFFVQTAYTLSYFPSRAAVGERLQRLYFTFVTTLQWRIVIMLSFGLTAFAQLFGLQIMADILLVLVPLMILIAAMVVSAVLDALGLVGFVEAILTFLVGLALGATWSFGLLYLGHETDEQIIPVTIAYAVVCGQSYMVTGIVPLTLRRPRLHAALSRNARRLAMIDLQTTAISLVFLWLATMRPM